MKRRIVTALCVAFFLTETYAASTSVKKEATPPKVQKQTDSVASSVSTDSTALSLTDAIFKTLGSNPSILNALATQRASEAAITKAKAGYLPKIDLSLSGGIESSRMPLEGNNFIELSKRTKHLTVDENIFDGGATTNQVAANKATFQSSLQQTLQTRLDLTAQAINAYMDVLRYRSLTALAVQNVKNHDDILRKVVSKYIAGAGLKSDMELAETRKYLAQVALLQDQNFLANSGSTFQNVIGEKPPKLADPAVPVQSLPASLPDAEQIALSTNPALKAADEDLKAAGFNLEANKAAFMPKIDVKLGAFYDNNIEGIPGPNQSQEAMLEMRYNLFNGGADKAEQRNLLEKQIATRENKNSIQRQIIQNVQQAWYNLEISKARYKQLEERVKTAQEVVTAYQKQFTLGQRSLLNLLDTERELFIAQSDLINSGYDVVNNAFILLATMGTLTNVVS